MQFGGKIEGLGSLGSDIDRGRAGFGVTAGAMGGGIFGAEVDFGYSPSFFGTNNDFGNNTVIDVMGNIIIGIPIGGTQRRRREARTSPAAQACFVARSTRAARSTCRSRPTGPAGTSAAE